MKPKINQMCECRPPRGATKHGRFVAEHVTHNGIWWEFKPLRGVLGENWRSRPASVTPL